MGPPSDNGGYAHGCKSHAVTLLLQWVHRLITVVMDVTRQTRPIDERLQWVHRLITVVMDSILDSSNRWRQASMGPPSDNGYLFTVHGTYGEWQDWP